MLFVVMSRCQLGTVIKFSYIDLPGMNTCPPDTQNKLYLYKFARRCSVSPCQPSDLNRLYCPHLPSFVLPINVGVLVLPASLSGKLCTEYTIVWLSCSQLHSTGHPAIRPEILIFISGAIRTRDTLRFRPFHMSRRCRLRRQNVHLRFSEH